MKKVNYLKKLHNKIEINNLGVSEFILKKNINKDNKDLDNTFKNLDQLIENIQIIKQIIKMEINNISYFNETADKLEVALKDNYHSENTRNLEVELEDSLEILEVSYLVSKSDYINFLNRYNDLETLSNS